jgi:hypothetical protein
MIFLCLLGMVGLFASPFRGSGCDEGLTSPVGKLKDGLDGGARGDRCFLGLGTTDHF